MSHERITPTYRRRKRTDETNHQPKASETVGVEVRSLARTSTSTRNHRPHPVPLTQRENAMNLTSNFPERPLWILLENGSITTIFCNPKYLQRNYLRHSGGRGR